MPRTIDPEAHALRRDAFVEVAQRLIATKGYEHLSVQDVIAELGASKGAFYHYFASKEALLAAVIETMVDGATVVAGPIAADPGLDALEKLKRLFGAISSWKGERKDLIIGFLSSWLSAENTVARERMRQAMAREFTPVLETVLCQGVDEGTFSVSSPHDTAAVLVALIVGLNDHATRMALARFAGEIPFEAVEQLLDAYLQAFERILGLEPGEFHIYDDDLIQYWFGDASPMVSGRNT
jgi:AcrR family transcriptional regulator